MADAATRSKVFVVARVSIRSVRGLSNEAVAIGSGVVVVAVIGGTGFRTVPPATIS
jgi:hypothetical protein